MTDDSRPTGDPRNDDATHTAVPVTEEHLQGGGDQSPLRDDDATHTAVPMTEEHLQGGGDQSPLRNDDATHTAVPMTEEHLQGGGDQSPLRNDDATHTGVPMTEEHLQGGGDQSPLRDDSTHIAVPVGQGDLRDEHGGNEPEFLDDATADPAFRQDTDAGGTGEQPDFLRDDEHVATAPAVPLSPAQPEDRDADRGDADRVDTDADEAAYPVATPANWPLPTAEPAWPTDPDVVTSSDLAAAEVPRTQDAADHDAHDDRPADDHFAGDDSTDRPAAAAAPERDSLDDLADAEGPYVPGSYSTDPEAATTSDADARSSADRTDTARYERPVAGDSAGSAASAGPVAAVVGAAAATGTAGAGAAATTEAPTVPQQPVYLQAPVPPKKKGNRGIGMLVVLVATLVFAALYAVGVGLLLSVTTPDAFGAPLLTYLATPMYWLPVIVFFVAFALLALLIHRANWWGFVLGGIPVAILVYGSYLLARVIQQNIFEITPNQAVDVIERSSTFPDGILAGLLARELVTWAGALISARARKVRARNAEDRAEYERKLAETPGFGPAS